MTKSDFRANISLAADLRRIEESIRKNKIELLKGYNDLKSSTPKIQEFSKKKSSTEVKESLLNHSTIIRDTIDNLETDMISLEGIDLIDFKTSPDDIILRLRKLNNSINKLDVKIEDQLKLISKLKGNGELQGEIDQSKKDLTELLSSSEKYVSILQESIDSVLSEINQFKSHSKDLLQQKIM